MKRIGILGSTGSIGTQTLEVVRCNPELGVAALAAGTSVDKMEEQVREFRPAMVGMWTEEAARDLRARVADLDVKVVSGMEGLLEIAEMPESSVLVTAIVGMIGIRPTIAAIKAGKDIALANKETLVVAGELVTGMLARSRSKVYPVDSEHSAIYQCLEGEDPASVSRLIITASGGPFRTLPAALLSTVTAAQALKHPNWEMGAKITIDSATMLNKAFEIIEARWLFGVAPDRIKAVVHPQSIVHSMVEFVDGAVKAQLGVPDMHLPISYALGAARRMPTGERPLTLADYASLTFDAPDENKFPCIGLARYSLERGGNTACIVNAANEIVNAAFRRDEVGFNDIYTVITRTVDRVGFIASPSLDDYIETNREARAVAAALVDEIAKKR